MPSKEKSTNLERLLKGIERSVDNYTELLVQRLSKHQEKVEALDSVIESSEPSNEAKAVAILARGIEFNDLSRLFGELSTLRTFQSLAINLRILEISLKETGTLKKLEEIGDVTKLKEQFQNAIKLLDKYYNEKRAMDHQAEESRSKDLWYIQ